MKLTGIDECLHRLAGGNCQEGSFVEARSSESQADTGKVNLGVCTTNQSNKIPPGNTGMREAHRP